MNKLELEKRKAAMSSRARAEIAKSEIVQFRFEPANILALYELAAKKKKPISTMVREWVMERMQTENQVANSQLEALQDLAARIAALEKRIGTTKGKKNSH